MSASLNPAPQTFDAVLLVDAVTHGRKAVDVIRRPWTVSCGVDASIVLHARLAAHFYFKAQDPSHAWAVVLA